MTLLLPSATPSCANPFYSLIWPKVRFHLLLIVCISEVWVHGRAPNLHFWITHVISELLTPIGTLGALEQFLQYAWDSSNSYLSMWGLGPRAGPLGWAPGLGPRAGPLRASVDPNILANG